MFGEMVAEFDSSYTLRGIGTLETVYNLVTLYRGGNKGLYVVARTFFLHLLNFSAWTCLCPAYQNKETFISPSVLRMVHVLDLSLRLASSSILH